jgi:hypothetical protein
MKLQPISYEPLRRDGFQDVEWLGKQLRSPSVISAIGGPHAPKISIETTWERIKVDVFSTDNFRAYLS